MMTDKTSWRPVHDPFARVPLDHPRDYDAIEIWREGWDVAQPANWGDMDPMMNVIGLMWRPTSERRTPSPYRLQPS